MNANDDVEAEVPGGTIATPRSSPLVFEGRVFDPATGEIREGDTAVRLAPLPARLLHFLIERPGCLVSREEIWQALWPDERIDLDQKLNFCVYQVRQALGDDASSPRFIETLPRRGYRFLPEVGLAQPDRVPNSEAQIAPPTRDRWAGALVATVSLTVVLAAAAVLLGMPFGSSQSSASESAMAGVAGSAPAGDLATAEKYAVARYILDEDQDPSRLAQAEELLRAVIEADPDFAPAYIGLSMAREGQGHATEARRLIERALALDPQSAEANHILGRFLLNEWDWDGSLAYLERALELDPGRAGAHHLLAHRAAVLGDGDEAVRQARAARAADPVIGRLQGDLGWIYLWSGRYDEAISMCEESIALVGPTSFNEECLIAARVAGGRRGEAADIARLRMKRAGIATGFLPPAADADASLVAYYRWSLDRFEAQLEAGETSTSLYAAARAHAFLGDDEAAFEMLHEAIARHDRWVIYANADPYFAELRSDVRYAEIARGLNLDRTALLTADSRP